MREKRKTMKNINCLTYRKQGEIYQQLIEAMLTANAKSEELPNVRCLRQIYTFIKALTDAEVEILDDGVMASVNGSVVIINSKIEDTKLPPKKRCNKSLENKSEVQLI